MKYVIRNIRLMGLVGVKPIHLQLVEMLIIARLVYLGRLLNAKCVTVTSLRSMKHATRTL